MSVFEILYEAYPDLQDLDFSPHFGQIHLKDDGDGIVYIQSWNYDKPLPKGLKIGK